MDDETGFTTPSSIVHRPSSLSQLPALAVAGSEGWLHEQALARIADLRLTEHVRLLGQVPEGKLPDLYRGARAFAMPSLYEGFGLPALEALASGTPVLASNAGSLPEVVGDAGILLDPLDPDAWAVALERVLEDEAEAARLRQAGPARASAFSWDKAATQTWELYESVIDAQ